MTGSDSPIQYEDLPDRLLAIFVLFAQPACGYRHIIVKAEAHTSIRLGMMTGWANDRETVTNAARSDGVAHFDGAATAESGAEGAVLVNVERGGF